MAQPAPRTLSRLSEIAQVMVRHGFGYFFEAHKLTDLIPGRRLADDGGVPGPPRHGGIVRSPVRLFHGGAPAPFTKL